MAKLASGEIPDNPAFPTTRYPGISITLAIEITALAELREPTEAELASLGEAKLGVVRTAGAGPAAGSMAESVTSVVKVVGLSLIGDYITVMTVGGELVDVQAKSEETAP